VSAAVCFSTLVVWQADNRTADVATMTNEIGFMA
jgi:hypothetical protein